MVFKAITIFRYFSLDIQVADWAKDRAVGHPRSCFLSAGAIAKSPLFGNLVVSFDGEGDPKVGRFEMFSLFLTDDLIRVSLPAKSSAESFRLGSIERNFPRPGRDQVSCRPEVSVAKWPLGPKKLVASICEIVSGAMAFGVCKNWPGLHGDRVSHATPFGKTLRSMIEEARWLMAAAPSHSFDKVMAATPGSTTRGRALWCIRGRME